VDQPLAVDRDAFNLAMRPATINPGGSPTTLRFGAAGDAIAVDPALP
jgi:hypothetical protein